MSNLNREYVGPNGNERPGEHWNARLIREAAEQKRAAAAVNAINKLRADFVEAHADGASSNDIVQLLDDWLVGQGLPTVLYAA